MEPSIKALLEDRVFYFFSQISDIPRESGNEKAISDYLKNFAQERGLFVRQDEYLNILIKKPATPGYEKAPIVILQGHMDMVCEKNAGTVHDFLKDPLKLVIEGDFLKADGTTLGGDNGIAVAYALALLDASDLPHPGLEVIVTTDEEVGLTGALAMDVSDVEGKYFVNLDSEEEGEFVVSCAGGLRAIFKMPLQYQKVERSAYNQVNLSIKGLKGGHSGVEIDKNRANANMLTGIVLCKLNDALDDLKVLTVSGGMKDNVITREGFSTILVNKNSMKVYEDALLDVIAEIQYEYKTSDPDIQITSEVVECDPSIQVLSKQSKEDLIFLLMSFPTGIQAMSAEIPGLVESSINLGKLRIEEDELVFEFATRSSVKSRKQRMVRTLQMFADKVGGTCIETKKYPEWPFKSQSKLLDQCVATYEKLYGRKPIVKGLHAGLESGVFLEKLPHLEAISFGPDLFDVHSPDERLSIPSTKRTWEYLTEVLKSLI
ncbi:MAG: aminoacyl-histidine dipeptidase [Vallitaleaceae bacterium]|nr:aminoacyl-histidine dipeptidase [Vallitaleaceae bacterium]